MDTGILNISDGNAPQTGRSTTFFVTRDTSLASGTQAVTGIGFKPSWVMGFVVQNGSPGEMSWGFCDENLVEGVMYDRHNVTANSWDVLNNSIVRVTQSSTDFYAANIQSYDADGFTFNWTKTGSPTGTVNIYMIAFK